MDKALFSLDVIEIASPCAADWDSMRGSDRVRHCGQCELNVYNLAEMSRADAETLVLEHEGRLCVRFYRRHDGTILTRDCPIGLRAVRRRLARMVTGIAALIAFLSCGAIFARGSGSSAKPASTNPAASLVISDKDEADECQAPFCGSPLQRLANWLDPPRTLPFAGSMVIPTTIQPETD